MSYGACRMAHVTWQDMKHEGRMFHCSHDQTAMSQKFMAEMKMGHENSDLGSRYRSLEIQKINYNRQTQVESNKNGMQKLKKQLS
jgi:hypothetical protein